MKLKHLVIIAVNSSILEIRTWPKPGNVHKTHSFPTTSYVDFLRAAYDSKWSWKKLLTTIEHTQQSPSTLFVTGLYNTVSRMMKAQSGGNVLLGHFLLNIPLFISSVYCINNSFNEESKFWEFCWGIIHNSKTSDTIKLYEAIRLAQPGGMGTIQKYDLYNDDSRAEILEDDITLDKIFNMSKTYDAISLELASNYDFIRNCIIPQFDKYMDEYPDIQNSLFSRFKTRYIINDIIDISEDLNELILRLFIWILSQRNDTLITRKTNVKQSETISTMARELLLKYDSLERSKWMDLIVQFDKELQNFNGKLNPGATADLLACTLFIIMIKRSIF